VTPNALDQAVLRDHPLPPIIDGNKETKGRLLVIAGSREVPGAALLTATAAMRAGAGKLRIATVQSVAAQLGMGMPEAMILGMPEEEDGGFAGSAVQLLAREAAEVDAVVAGPGVKRSNACALLARALLEGNAALAFDVALLKSLRQPDHERTITPVLLPDADELAALLDADLYRSIVLVKGVVSHVVTPGGDAWRYGGGAPGLGVSGSGDVLAGIVGGLLARGAEPLNALLWSVWLHGEAGAALAKRIGPIGFLAREIPDEIPALLRV
jgi:hydroxyethylthiazole kinase-like uncharacterized protein yjeF